MYVLSVKYYRILIARPYNSLEHARCITMHFPYMSVNQILFVGGLFTQFSLDSDGDFVVDQGGVRSVPAVQMAIDRINDKNDGIYDKLLPNTKVWCQNVVDSSRDSL